MARTKSWILTNVAADTWLKSFAVSSADFPQPAAAAWSIRKRTLRGGRRDGVDLIEVDNGALSFSVLPTRGMGLWRGQYRGRHLGWRSPTHGPVHPQHVNLLDRGGLGWLDGFDEWICRCGLHSNGPPGQDAAREEFLTLHGRIANRPAQYVEVRVEVEPPHKLIVLGQVDEATLFFSKLRLTTLLLTTPGSNRLVIKDTIENFGSHPAELQLLYHCQFSLPFLEAGSRVHAPIREVVPRNAHAAASMSEFDVYQGPTAGFAEQVYFYDLLTNEKGSTLALLHNARADLGVTLRWAGAELPRFSVWKNTAAVEDGYVTGLEPATNYPNFKAFERDHGRVMTLAPGGRHTATLTVEVHDTAAGVTAVLKEIGAIQAQAAPLLRPEPQPNYCG